jgi:hypothetical protein
MFLSVHKLINAKDSALESVYIELFCLIELTESDSDHYCLITSYYCGHFIIIHQH